MIGRESTDLAWLVWLTHKIGLGQDSYQRYLNLGSSVIIGWSDLNRLIQSDQVMRVWWVLGLVGVATMERSTRGRLPHFSLSSDAFRRMGARSHKCSFLKTTKISSFDWLFPGRLYCSALISSL